MIFEKYILIACASINVTLIAYFFYWNRIIAFLLTRILRFLFWNQDGSSLWIDIGAIHFSLLAGRVMLRDVRYHSSNQTFRIVKAQIQWRYWIRRPTSEDEIDNSPAGEDKFIRRALSCRVQVTMQGLEWLIYNRTAAYEAMLSQLDDLSRPTSNARPALHRREVITSKSPFLLRSFNSRPLSFPQSITRLLTWFRGQLPSLDPKDLLPIGIEVSKGAIICGNATTRSLLVFEFQRTEGTFGIVRSRSKCDLYKQILSLRFHRASMRFVDNDQFIRDHDMSSFGDLLHSFIKQHAPQAAEAAPTYRSFVKWWRQLSLYSATQDYMNSFRAPKKSKSAPQNDPSVGGDFLTMEYAIERKILEAPLLELSYYADVVGLVPPGSHATLETNMQDNYDVGNGGLSPEWGIDLVVRGGFIRYGPWADRQRAELQKSFFPPTYQNVTPTERLRPGDKRVWTNLRVFIELREETTLYIPFRESSKNWEWDSQSGNPVYRHRKREYASIHIKAGDQSSINYIIPMVASPNGYEAELEIHLDTVMVTSSLNDIRLAAAESCRVRCNLPSPLQWRSERTWDVGIYLRQPTLYLLRDHINMFTDLGQDWATGPLSDYYRFIPMIYAVHIELHHYKLHLYANDHNIIDKPLIKEDNALFIFHGPSLKSDVTILSNKFRPESTTIPFRISGDSIVLNLALPRWNTHATHASADGNTIGRLGTLKLNGSYQYFSEVRPEFVEQLKLNFVANRFTFKALGWSIRYFMILKDNYFGSFTHFVTLYEYLEKIRNNRSPGDPVEEKYREGKTNLMQVELTVVVDTADIILPAGLMGYEHGSNLNKSSESIGTCLALTVPEVQLQFRMHDYYMEMSENIGVITGRLLSEYPEALRLPEHYASKDAPIFIDGIDITAHRLFGPQPQTATYLCIWEIHLGHVKAAISASDAFSLIAIGNAFKQNFTDLPNAPASKYIPSLDPDVTFIKISLDHVDMMWKAGFAAAVFSLPQGAKLATNDLGGSRFKKLLSLQVPRLLIQVLLTASSEKKPWLEAAALTADVFLDVYSCPEGWRTLAQKQIEFVEKQDALTNRVLRMIEGHRTSPSDHTFHRSRLFLPQPTLTHLPAQLTAAKTAKVVIKPRPFIPSNASIVETSESEGEEVISEADRDARLARMRISTPVSISRDEESMSSGDESDNEDLTDAEFTDSDWSDDAGHSLAPSMVGSKALLNFYTHSTRHYEARHIHNPYLWNDTPFVLTKDRNAFDEHVDNTKRRTPFPASERHKTKAQPIHPVPPVYTEIPTTYHVRSQKGICVRLTPLILPSVRCFDEDLARYVPTPEIFVDSFLSLFLSEFSNSKDKVPKEMSIIDVKIPFISFGILHHIAMYDGDTMYNSQKPRTAPLTLIDNLAQFNIDLQNLVIRAATGTADQLNISLGDLGIHFTTAPSSRTTSSINPLHNETKIHFGLQSAHVDHQGGTVSLSWDNFSLQIGHQSINFVVAAALAVMRTGKILGNVFQRYSERATTLRRRMITAILKASAGQDIVDPLSTIQPSYLIQDGTPRELRSDVIFRFLYHLRNCLWYAPLELSAIDSNPIVDTDLRSLLGRRLEKLDVEVNQNSLTLIANLFLRTVPQKPFATQSLRRLSFNFHFSSTSFSVMDPMGQSSSSVSLKDAHINIHDRLLSVLQFSSPSIALSQVSLREAQPLHTKQVFISFIIGAIDVDIVPHLMRFIENVLRVRRHHAHYWNSLSGPGGNASPTEYPLVNTSFTATVGSIRIRAVAKNLAFEFGTVSLKLSLLLQTRSMTIIEQSGNMTLLFNSLFFRARSPSYPHTRKTDEQDILASLEFFDGKASSAARNDNELASRLMVSLEAILFQVPRSALKLYNFIEEWRVDFLAEIGTSFQALLNEFQRAPARPDSPTSSTRSSIRSPLIQVQCDVRRFGITLQIMHGTWITWNVNDITGFFSTTKPRAADTGKAMGIQIKSQDFIVANKSRSDIASNTRVRLILPSMSATGQFNGVDLVGKAFVERIDLKVKPSHWDTLLVVQQKFGQDFSDLLALIRKHQSQSPQPIPVPPPTRRSIKFAISIYVSGLQIGLEGRSSTLYLNCERIGGGFGNITKQKWYLNVFDLALSLEAARGIAARQTSAFVKVNIRLNGGGTPEDPLSMKTVDLSITKIHARMQPSSVGEVGDYIDQLQAEMLERKQKRALELAAFKQKTVDILKTFDVRIPEIQPADEHSWLDDYVIKVNISNVGVAFPLALDHDLGSVKPSKIGTDGERVFLFSIRSIEFGSSFGESGQAVMRDLSFQFVPYFSDFSQSLTNAAHLKRNRLLYPEMKAQLRSVRLDTTRNIWASADVSGFILDLDPSVPDYVFSLIDVYRQGKARVEKLSVGLPRTLPNTEDFPPSSPATPGQSDDAIPAIRMLTNMFASLTFASGKVRIFNTEMTGPFRGRTTSQSIFERDDPAEIEAEAFNLPNVSVWAVYRAAPLGSGSISTLIFKSTIHSSQNTLKPNLLPFITDLVTHLEARLRKISIQTSQPILTPVQAEESVLLSAQTEAISSSLQISFSLRIDQSRLELSCQPDVNVIAGLHWESGGFIVNISPSPHRITFTGSVGGLTVDLKHGFLSEHCVKLDARNLAFSVDFSKVKTDSGYGTGSLSIVVETEFHGVVRFSRLQDILCFKAVWLDRIPVFARGTLPNKPARPRETTSPQQVFSTIVLVRIREIVLDLDLGRSISALKLKLGHALLRTNLSELIHEVFLFIGSVSVVAIGNIAGYLTVPDCMFSTTRRLDFDGDEKERMLDLRLTSGPLVATLESEEQTLLHYRAEPLNIAVVDNWSEFKNLSKSAKPSVTLSFIVTSPKILAVTTVSTIPRLMLYAAKFTANIDAQREGASRESKTFRISRTPKPDNPLSAVAEAMIHSARSRFKEVEMTFSHAIKQHIHLRLQHLHLIVFPRKMYDNEMAQFVGHDIEARLRSSLTAADLPIERDIQLAFSSMVISKVSGLTHAPRELSEKPELMVWLLGITKNASEATIVGLPSMSMRMISSDLVQENGNILEYDFRSDFKRDTDQIIGRKHEDIYITLNVSLYSWLTLLRKTLTREMDQIKATTQRTTATNVANGNFHRKQIPTPLSIDATRFEVNESLSLSPPLGSRQATMEGNNPSITLSPMQSTATDRNIIFPTSPKELAESSNKHPFKNTTQYIAKRRHIERLTMRQLGEATPDVMHPFFMKAAGFNLEDSLPQYVHEYATLSLEEIMEVLLTIYNRQLLSGRQQKDGPT